MGKLNILRLFVILVVAQLTAITLVAKAAENDTAIVVCQLNKTEATYNVVLARVFGNCKNSVKLPAEGQCNAGSPCEVCLHGLHNVLLDIKTSDRIFNNKVAYVLRATNEVACQR